MGLLWVGPSRKRKHVIRIIMIIELSWLCSYDYGAEIEKIKSKRFTHDCLMHILCLFPSFFLVFTFLFTFFFWSVFFILINNPFPFLFHQNRSFSLLFLFSSKYAAFLFSPVVINIRYFPFLPIHHHDIIFPSNPLTFHFISPLFQFTYSLHFLFFSFLFSFPFFSF